MKSCKQLLTGTACAALILGAVSVRAADDAGADEFSSKIASGENVVLFKVHDVTPVKDDQGVVTDCEFGLTIYNRSPKSVDAATINLNWNDEGIANVIDSEEKMAEQGNDGKQVESLSQASRPRTADFEKDTLSTSVILPQIKPFRQVSLKSKIKSDRCFLMIEDAEFSFSACSITDQTSVSSKRLASAKSQGSGNDCKALFRFVSPRDPEYYREFQKVSFNEEAKRREESRKKDIDELDAAYQKMLDGLNNITTTLDSIK